MKDNGVAGDQACMKERLFGRDPSKTSLAEKEIVSGRFLQDHGA
jgi:hypothetical protein